jgi:hypothetical protein
LGQAGNIFERRRQKMIQLTVEELGELLRKIVQQGVRTSEACGIVSGKSHSFEIGKAYLIRTVTMHYTGRVVDVTDSDVVLEDAAWIADTGRFANSLVDGTLSEVEPYPGQVAVCRGAMVDFCEWKHGLPRSQK